MWRTALFLLALFDAPTGVTAKVDGATERDAVLEHDKRACNRRSGACTGKPHLEATQSRAEKPMSTAEAQLAVGQPSGLQHGLRVVRLLVVESASACAGVAILAELHLVTSVSKLHRLEEFVLGAEDVREGHVGQRQRRLVDNLARVQARDAMRFSG